MGAYSRVAGLSPRRRLLVVLVVLLALAGGVAVAVRVAGGGKALTGPPAQSRPGPVLLVPGYGGSRESLAVLADRIRATGRTATVLTLLGDGTGDLTTQAGVLDIAVRDVLAAGAPSVDVIGYSAGGVVARIWAERPSGVLAARRVVTLGSPYHGTQLAALGSVIVPGVCPLACQQLVPGSGLLTELNQVPVPPTLPWLSVWTENDRTVTPPESARLTGAVNVPVQQVCADSRIDHGDLPTDPLVIGLVLRAIDVAPLTPPAAADCPALRALGGG